MRVLLAKMWENGLFWGGKSNICGIPRLLSVLSPDLLSGIAEKWEELIWFYFSKGLHQKALDWMEDAHGERCVVLSRIFHRCTNTFVLFKIDFD